MGRKKACLRSGDSPDLKHPFFLPISFGISRLDCDQDKLDVQKKQIKCLIDKVSN